jgi:DnaJ-class molecular chaperone
METYFDTLNLRPDATLEDVKESYRRLAKRFHPDSAGPSQSNPLLFAKVHEAYRALLKDHVQAEHRSREPKKAAAAEPSPSPSTSTTEEHGPQPEPRPAPRPSAQPEPLWRFEGVTDAGPDAIYVLWVHPQAIRRGLKVALPIKMEDACPRCLGAGHTFAPVFGGPHLRRMTCPKCRGAGVAQHNGSVHLEFTEAEIRQGRARRNNLGHYLPRQGRRGDLVVLFQTETDHQPGSTRYSA